MRSSPARSPFDDEQRPWLEMLEAVGPPADGLKLPARSDLDAILGRLRVDERDAYEIRAFWPSPSSDRDLWWLLERSSRALANDLGGYRSLGWPSLPAGFGGTGRYFWVYAYLSVLPALADWYRTRGIGDEILWATLRDLGRNLRRDRRLFGEGGLRTHGWLSLHFRGGIYELGRLQFNRSRVPPAYVTDGLVAGDQALGVHIYEGEPLTPDACDASLGRAREFFARHFPETPVRAGICTSWLLDEQLSDYLPATSNIIRFGRRFRPIAEHDGDGDVLRFVFGRLAMPDLDALPQRTSLERALVAHWRAGGHWRNRTGWIET